MPEPIANPRFVGLDAHKRQITFCILDPTGQVLQRGQIPTTRPAIAEFAQNTLRPTDHLALEATTNSWTIADLLQPHVQRVVVSNPLTTKAIAAAKIKTDKIDARVLANLLRCDYLPQVWQPDPTTRQLRRLTSRRAALCADRTSLKNRLHATLAMRLIAPPTDSNHAKPLDLFNTKGLAWLRQAATTPDLDPHIDDETRAALASDLRLLDLAQTELDTLDQTLAHHAYHQDQVKLLMTLPGFDYTTAIALLAAWGDPSRFPDAAHATSYLGLTPSTRQSDAHCYHGPITKHGDNHARWLLVQAAQHTDKHPGPLGVFFRRLAHKKCRNVAVVATARKLALIAWHMLATNQPYHYALPDPTSAKLARLRLKAGGPKRPSGSPKGAKSRSRCDQGGRTRTIPALPALYQREALPAMRPPKPAQQRVLNQTGLTDYVLSLQAPRTVRRNLGTPPAPQA
jgi:transposase